MSNNELAKLARSFARGKGVYVRANRGRTDRVGWAFPSIPVRVVGGDSEPALRGLPYWKTRFKRGSFSKVLYTPSTLRVEVGKDWNPYNDDNH